MSCGLGFSTCRRLIKREVSAGKSHVGRQSLTENELAPTPRGLANRVEPRAFSETVDQGCGYTNVMKNFAIRYNG
jgi:hypothetical protein